MNHGPTKTDEVLAGGIVFKARSLGNHGSSCNVEMRHARTVANAARGLKDLQDVARLILRRLDIEAAEKGENAQFICSAYRTELREALRGCDGLERAPSGYWAQAEPRQCYPFSVHVCDNPKCTRRAERAAAAGMPSPD